MHGMSVFAYVMCLTWNKRFNNICSHITIFICAVVFQTTTAPNPSLLYVLYVSDKINMSFAKQIHAKNWVFSTLRLNLEPCIIFMTRPPPSSFTVLCISVLHNRNTECCLRRQHHKLQKLVHCHGFNQRRSHKVCIICTVFIYDACKGYFCSIGFFIKLVYLLCV